MTPSPGRSRPNVLLVIADDHRHDALAHAGNPVVQTPHLDALAARGCRFTRAYHMGGLVAAVCSPARASLLTGCNAIAADACPGPSSGAATYVALPPRARTLPQAFREAGYTTFVTGKWHNDVPALQRSFSDGRRIFLGGMSDHDHVPLRPFSPTGNYGAPPVYEPGFSTELFCDAAVEFLGRARDPFFLYLALTSPHDPRTPPPEFARLYPPERIPLPANFLPAHPFDNGEMAIRDELLAPRPLTPSVVRRQLADYYGMVSHQDAQLGRVFAALRAAGREEDTIVVYVSDHGLSLGAHGLLGKQNMYEESMRVPLILAGPGVPVGRRADLVYSLDLFATLASLAGIDPPAGTESRSLFGPRPGRDQVFGLYRDCQRMVLDERWKLIRYRVDRTERLQLFDLQRDPDELTDLAAAPDGRPIVRRLLAAMAAWQHQIGDRWVPPPPAAG
ncbi:MAG TPA: sulfatase-like hydrolase/transferase [Opitutaceae bacterium]|nr:sulfatase-like hydrolase/transferase [Opitutaceae bacterium]